MKRKLKNARGETLVEVLVSIVIGALSVMLLFGAVAASVSMDRTAKKKDEDFNQALNAAEAQAAPTNAVAGTNNTVTVENTDPDVTVTARMPVFFYGGEGALSYALPTPTPPP